MHVRQVPVRFGWPAIAAAWLACTLAAPQALAQEDNAQGCMFLCAPVVGTPEYDGCVEQCFADNDIVPAQPETAVRGDDFSPLYGQWEPVGNSCGTPSTDIWVIDATGASLFDFTCTAESARVDGSSYTLEQSCADFEGATVRATDVFKLIGPGLMETDGRRFQQCSGG